MKYYKARLLPDESGLKIWFNILKPIHETEYFHFCVDALQFHQAINVIESNPDLNPVTSVKQSGFFKVYRIHKAGSRIAQPSKEDAIQNLIYRTKLRIGHMEREIDFCKAFLSNQGNLSLDYKSDRQLALLVGNTKDTVHQYYNIFR